MCRYVLLGNHRDAWTFGAVDPNSGTAALLEVKIQLLQSSLGWFAYVGFLFLFTLLENTEKFHFQIAHRFGKLLRRGWQPRRTIILCSWDAEEYGMVCPFHALLGSETFL
jgi:N-acetylated-alpha-linked acidic dipeptidase